MRIVARAQDPPPDPRFRARGAVWVQNIFQIVIYIIFHLIYSFFVQNNKSSKGGPLENR